MTPSRQTAWLSRWRGRPDVLGVLLGALLCGQPCGASAQTEGSASLGAPTPDHRAPTSPPATRPAPPGPATPDPTLPPPYAPLRPAEGTLIEVPIEDTPYPNAAPDARSRRRERRRVRWAPDRVRGHRLALGAVGFGGDIDGGGLSAEWRFRARRSFFALSRLGPLAMGVAGADRIGVADASFVLGYDTRLFAAGVGVGLTYLRVDDTLRRSEGTATIGRLHLRAGALDGVHAQLDLGGTRIGSDLVGTHTNLRFRFPLRRGRLLDVLFEAMPHASWVQLQAGLLLRIPGLSESPWRVRPHVGVVEIIDAVGRDGGPALAVGVQLVRLERSP